MRALLLSALILASVALVSQAPNHANASDPATAGAWAAPIDWPEVAVHGVLLSSGKVLTWQNGSAISLWDPASGNFTDIAGTGDDIFCAGHATLPDGRVLIEGGAYISDVNIFDPITNKLTRTTSMHADRFYPTATTLADGRVLAVAGDSSPEVPEVFDPATSTWTRLPSLTPTLPYYPNLYTLADGTVVDTGASEQATATYRLNVGTDSYTTVDPNVVDGASTTMYAPGKILKVGTAADGGESGNAAATAYVLDMNQPSPAWRQVASMANPRAFVNLTTLPDGTVLATGGDTTKLGETPSTAVYAAELWSPTTETWTTLSSMTIPRLYHSIAMLLPDGRVLVTGGGASDTNPPAPNEENAEIYSPPYLFKGPRPAISSAPASALTYGNSFFVGTPDASSVTSVALMRTAAVTHAFDENARLLNLSFSVTPGGLNIDAPADANLAPPGDYMLFLVNGNGVPSVSTMVRLPVPGTQGPSAPASAGPSVSGNTVHLTWTAPATTYALSGYTVYRSTTPAFAPDSTSRIGTAATPSFTDAGLVAGTYYYEMTAQDVEGNISAPSTAAPAVVVSGATPTATATIVPTATDTPLPGTTATFGNQSFAAGDDTGEKGPLNGSPATLTTAGTLTTLSLHVGAVTAGAHIRLGLYSTNASGLPQTLLAESASTPAVQGWNQLPVPPVALAAGSYWILAQTDSAGTGYGYASGLGSGAVWAWTTQSVQYTNFPQAVGALSQHAGSAFAMYGTVSTADGTTTATATVTNTPAPPPTNTATATNTAVAATNTPMATPTEVATATNTAVATDTALATASATATATNTAAAAATDTPTETNTTVATLTNTPAPTQTPTAVATATATPTATSTAVATATNTATATDTATATRTGTATATPTRTPTATLTPTRTATPTATDTPPPGTTAAFGNQSFAAGNDFGEKGPMNGSPATLTTAGTLTTLSLHVGAVTAGAHIRLGLYSTNAAGLPQALLAESAITPAVAGWNALPVPPVALSPGRYWMFAQTDSASTGYGYASGLGSGATWAWTTQSVPYTDFPQTVGTLSQHTGSAFAMYGTVSTGAATATATATNTPDATNTATATDTVLATVTNTPTPTGVATATNTPTPTVATATNTPTATNTAAAPATDTPVATDTAVATSTASPTNTTVAAATNTPTPTATAVATATDTPTATPTVVATATNTPTPTPSAVATATATATPTPGATATFGNQSFAAGNDFGEKGPMNGSPVTVTTAGTLTTLSLHIGAVTAGAHIRLALYSSDASGLPQTLLAESANTPAVAGWNALPVPPVSLGTGRYWIFAQTDSASTGYGYASGLGSGAEWAWTTQSVPYTDFPPTVGTLSQHASLAFALYATVVLP